MIEALKERRLMKRLAAINRETVPQRPLFAKGAGAHGFFQPYMALSDYTTADFLSGPNKVTPVFVRFSKALPQNGETGRDLRGFAVRFYTEEGNYDLIAGSMPVFYINDPLKLPGLIESLKREKTSNLVRTERFWTFAAANPETFPMILHLYGDRGTVKSYRHMPGYSVNTYRWTNKKKGSFLVRYRWEPMAGARCITRQESEFLAGFDEDAASRDLYENLKEGKNVEYELLVQLIPEEEAAGLDFSPIDLIQDWPEKVVEPLRVGKMTLTHPSEDYANEVERVAFSPGNLVPGVGFSQDAMLPVMAFAMEDSQRRRMEGDYERLPVNCSRAVRQRREEEEEEAATVCSEKRGRRPDSHYQAAGSYYKRLTGGEKERLQDNIIDDLMFLKDELQRELARHFLLVDEDLGKEIAKRLAF